MQSHQIPQSACHQHLDILRTRSGEGSQTSIREKQTKITIIYGNYQKSISKWKNYTIDSTVDRTIQYHRKHLQIIWGN